MPWTALGIVGLLSLWAACGVLAWCVTLVARRGEGALRSLPLAIVGGMVGGLVVALFAKDGVGFAVSLAAALVAGGFAVAALLVRGTLLGRTT